MIINFVDYNVLKLAFAATSGNNKIRDYLQYIHLQLDNKVLTGTDGTVLFTCNNSFNIEGRTGEGKEMLFKPLENLPKIGLTASLDTEKELLIIDGKKLIPVAISYVSYPKYQRVLDQWYNEPEESLDNGLISFNMSVLNRLSSRLQRPYVKFDLSKGSKTAIKVSFPILDKFLDYTCLLMPIRV
jgi:hypothetical protein